MEFSLRQSLDATSISADHKKGIRLSQGRMTVRDFSPKDGAERLGAGSELREELDLEDAIIRA
jgi:hypothetical protein